MRRCLAFFAAMFLCGLSARADYMYVRIDLSQVYDYIPAMQQGAIAPVSPVGPRGPGPGPGGIRPNPVGQPNNQPDKPPQPGDGPFVQAIFEIKSDLKFDGPPDAQVAAPKANPKNKVVVKQNPKLGAHLFDHEFGKKGRFITSPDLAGGIIKYTTIVRPSPAQQYIQLFRKDLAKGTDPKRFVTAATWALQHGLNKEFRNAMDEYVKIEPKNPVAVNYRRVSDAFKKPLSSLDPELNGLVDELTKQITTKYHTVVGDSGFYSALSNLSGENDSVVKRRIGLLHDTMERFYYWFALNDKLPQPELPKYRQLLIVTNLIDDFYTKHAEWGSPTFSGEGLTPRRDNFILNSWRPIDDAYQVFDHSNQQLNKKLQMPKDWLITGSVWEPGTIPANIQIDPFQVAFAQTVNLVQRAMEDDAEVATLTREGARQLLFSSGILPRHVHVPEWIAQGLASYFGTSSLALYPTVGLPNAADLVALKFYRANKQLGKPAEVLLNVIDDRYFRTAQQCLLETSEFADRDKLVERARVQTELGNATAWALAYYVIERRRDPKALIRYCQELSTLPRDLDFDERVLEAVFAKAFELGDANDPLRLDAAKMASFANNWFEQMSGITLESPELQIDLYDARKLSAKKNASN